MLNATTVVVQVSSDGAWHVSTAALDTDPARGYMHLDSSAATTLASPMQVLVRSGQPVSLAGSDPVRVGQGSGSASLGVVLEQSIGPADTPGTYTIELVFSAISGF